MVQKKKGKWNNQILFFRILTLTSEQYCHQQKNHQVPIFLYYQVGFKYFSNSNLRAYEIFGSPLRGHGRNLLQFLVLFTNLLTGAAIPSLKDGWHASYLKVKPKHLEFPLLTECSMRSWSYPPCKQIEKPHQIIFPWCWFLLLQFPIKLILIFY